MGVGAAVSALLLITPGASATSYGGKNPYEKVMAKFSETSDFDGVALVSENGKTLFQHARGLANEEFQVPMKVIMYCGGMKCCVTCNIMYFSDADRSVLINAYSNHMHYGFPTKKDFEDYLPNEFINELSQGKVNISVQTAGGAEELPQLLLGAYMNSTSGA
ncbi:hypothetical protein ATCC90586_004984 [Pythium insidiosum]|nr:hypothetical protein ATCC90586_004984 [Pythium insidiosum]